MNIKIQSIADVITNSSSEIFVIKDEKDTSCSIEAYEGFLYDLEEYSKLFLKAEHLDNSYLSVDEVSELYEADIASHKHYDYVYDYSYDVGDLLIESVGDNSIPYEVMKYIEESAERHGYKCKRRHLG